MPLSASQVAENATSLQQPLSRTVGNPLTSSRELLSQNAQQLIEDLNAKRKRDTQMLTDLRSALDLHVSIIFLYMIQFIQVKQA